MVDLIKPSQLPSATAVAQPDVLVIDDGVTVQKATTKQIVDAGNPVATEAEAIAGTDNSARMTPLRVRQVLDDTTAPSVARAQAWAESPTPPEPTNPDSKSAKTWAGVAEAGAEAANRAPTSWGDFQSPPFINLKDGAIAQFNGVLSVRDSASSIAGLRAGPGWKPYGPTSSIHFGGNINAALAYDRRVVADVDQDVEPITEPSIKELSGFGTLKRTTPSTMISSIDVDGLRIEGIALDLDRDGSVPASGSGMSLRGNNITVDSVTVEDFGATGAGSGTGIMLLKKPDDTYAEKFRIKDSLIKADPAADIAVGWLMAETQNSFASGILVEDAVGGIGYAHELKEDARYNNLYGLTARNCNAAVAYGEESGTAPSYNVATGVIAGQCNVGVLTGQNSVGNLFNGVFYDPTGSIGGSETQGVRLSGTGNEKNAVYAMVSHGAAIHDVYVNSDRNYVQLAALGTSTNIVTFTTAADKNVIDITHAGARTSILANVNDVSGKSTKSANANVVSCNATREYIGSQSGRFNYILTASGASETSAHNFLFEDAGGVYLTAKTDGQASSNFGIIHNIPGATRSASLTHVVTSVANSNSWRFRVQATDVVDVNMNGIRPLTNSAIDLGTSTSRWRNVYSDSVRVGASGAIWTTGAGTPEGSVTAPVGSMYTRTDGGAGTTLYVKESGTGSTGWVAK